MSARNDHATEVNAVEETVTPDTGDETDTHDPGDDLGVSIEDDVE
jgi:hypothetical protein